MDKATIDGWQLRQLEWRKKMFPGNPSPIEGGLGVFEELGELTHAELKMFQAGRYGVEPRYEGVDFSSLAQDACADAVIYALSLSNCLGVQLSIGVEAARSEVASTGLGSTTSQPVLRAMAEACVHAGILVVLSLYDKPIESSILSRLGLVVAWLEVYSRHKGFDLVGVTEKTLTEVCARERKQ